MKKTLFILFLAVIYSLHFNNSIFATEKNIFGLHLTQTQDLDSASKIINSQGGDWGYVTLVIRLDQMNRETWQEFFNQCREKHLIPIVRLATIMENNNWKRPEISDIDNLTSFLNSLNWPTRDQHVIMFNEINHGTEWGGTVDIKSFTDISIYTYQKLKSLNPNFKVLSMALDLAAPDQQDKYFSASKTHREIYRYRPEYYDNFDALASHSYPNHGYVGTPNDTGQHSIRGYNWELNLIKSLGISKTYPVYITETGWPHREGEQPANNFYTSSTAADFFIKALNIWSKDDRVIAATPFIYNYPHPPFDHFSWLDSSETLYPAYNLVVDTPKVKNNPPQKTSYEVIANHLPFILITDTEYTGKIILKNTGQSIWGETGFCLIPQTTTNVTLDAICTSGKYIRPGASETFEYKLKIKADPEYQDKTIVSWETLPPFEITPISGFGSIYSPNTTLKQKIIQYIQSWFI